MTDQDKKELFYLQWKRERFVRLVHTAVVLQRIDGRLSTASAWDIVKGAEDIRAESLPLDIDKAAEQWIEFGRRNWEEYEEDWIRAALKGKPYRTPGMEHLD